MRLESLLAQNKRAILREWFDSLMGTYPADSAKFLKREGDPFSNPIGSSAKAGLEAILGELLGGKDSKALSKFLDPIIRIRAAQNFTPAQATGFILLLKQLIRKILAKELSSRELLDELLAFELRIDELALIGFDLFMECREKIYQLKEKEVKNRALLAFSQNGPVNNGPE